MVSLSSLCWPSLAVLALHPRYCGLALANAAAQLGVFLVTAVVPALATGRMLVLQKVPSEANPKVRNHGEGPY